MQKIRKNDTVVVLAGKCKGLEGKVLRVYPRFGKVLVDGVNLVKKHVKPNPDKNEKGGIVEKELPIHLSNVGLKLPFKVDNSGDKIKKHGKVGVRTLNDGRKVRYFKFNDELVDIV